MHTNLFGKTMTLMITTDRLEQDSDFCYDSCPDSLGFDVVVQLRLPVITCNAEDTSHYDIEHVWMEIGSTIENTRWLDVRKSMPRQILDELVQSLDK
jgi:hypothetical protein